MGNWIWVVVVLVFLYLMMRRGGCCGMAHYGDGERAAGQTQPEGSERAGEEKPASSGEHEHRRRGCC